MTAQNKLAHYAAFILGGVTLAMLAEPVYAIDVLRAKVYGYKTLEKGEVEIVYSAAHVAKSDLTMDYFGKSDVKREKLTAQSIELEYGMTDRWSVSIYGDFEQPKGEDFKFVQARSVVSRYRFFEKGDRFFDAGIYFEYYVPREQYRGVAKEKLETRVILQKDFGAWSMRLNPILEKGLSQDNLDEGLVLEYTASLYKEISPKLDVGLEAYGEFGPIANIASTDDQQHYFAPGLEYKVKHGMAVNLAYAFGTNASTDDRVIKANVEFEL